MEEARPKAQEVEHGSNSYQNATLRKFLKLLISEVHGILSNDTIHSRPLLQKGDFSISHLIRHLVE
jgi:hypothetical protein